MQPSSSAIDYLPTETTAYLLPDLLPSGECLVAHPDLSLLIYLATNETETVPSVKGVCQLTDHEWMVTLPVIASYPNFCPYEVLYDLFYNGHVSELGTHRARAKLYKALDEGVFDEELRPIRNVLSRGRIKCQSAFGLTIGSLLETGYLLRPYRARVTARPELVSV